MVIPRIRFGCYLDGGPFLMALNDSLRYGILQAEEDISKGSYINTRNN